MFLLDSNVVSELRRAGSGRADPGVVGWAEQVDPGALVLSVVTRNMGDFLPAGVEVINPWSQAPSWEC
jgi:hypothetical protein